MSENHSALPFKAEQTEPPSGFTSHYLLDANGKTVAAIDAKNGDANAAFIERACNVHDELVGALEKVKALWAFDAEHSPGELNLNFELCEEREDLDEETASAVEAALKLAKGGE